MPLPADCVIGQSFGVAENYLGLTNNLLAQYIIQKVNEDLPLLLQKEIADSIISLSDRTPSIIIDGKPSTSTGGELDSWQVLKRGIDPIAPDCLPNQFDSESTQI